MNKILTAAAAIGLALGVAQAGAQAPAAAPAGAGAVDAAKIAKLRDRIRTDRKALVAQNLPLSDEEAKAFWPAYEKCQKSIETAHRKVNRAIVEFIGSESRMTDAHAKQLMKEVLEAEAAETKARRSCFDGVAKVLPGKKAARYFQIETKLDALTRFDVAVTVPLVD